MKKQPRLSPMFVALSLALASSPLPAAAQMRVQGGVGSGAVVPAVPAIGGGILPSAGALSNSLMPIGLNGSLAATSVAPSPLVSVVPIALAPASSALTVVTQQTGAMSIAKEAAANASVPAANAPTAKSAAVGGDTEAARTIPPESNMPNLPGRKFNESDYTGTRRTALHRRSAASVSFDGTLNSNGVIEPVKPASSGGVWTKEMLAALLASNEAAIRSVRGVKDVQISNEGSLPVLIITVAGKQSIAGVKKAVEMKAPAIQRLNGIMGAPSQVQYRPAA